MAHVNPYSGQKAWDISGRTLKIKFKDSMLFSGVFIGVGLVAFSVTDLHLYFIHLILGVLIAPLALIYRETEKYVEYTMVAVEGEEADFDNWEDEPKQPKPQYIKMFLSYALSTLGIGLTVGGWYAVEQDTKHFFTYTSIGLVFTFLARYKFKLNRLLGIIEDYFMYFTIFLATIGVAYGISILTSSPIAGILLIISGSTLAPVTLIWREKMIFKQKKKNGKRKYFTLVAASLGIGCMLVGVFSLLNGQWLQSLLLLEGLLLLYGGAIVNEKKYWLSLAHLL